MVHLLHYCATHLDAVIQYKSPVEYKGITRSLLVDLQMDIIQKLQYVSGENLTNTPSSTTYASVVSQDSEKNYFIFAALNDLDILAWYIQNTHLNEETKDECFFYAGDE